LTNRKCTALDPAIRAALGADRLMVRRPAEHDLARLRVYIDGPFRSGRPSLSSFHTSVSTVD
jgi:hypothetical protein